MAATIPSLWPDDIKVDLLPPATILRIQASQLSRLTRGILDAEVTTVTEGDDLVTHRLDLLAPVLAGRRYRVLSATHRTDFYPLVVEADLFRPGRPRSAPADSSKSFVRVGIPMVAVGGHPGGSFQPPPWPNTDDWRPVAANQDEFLKLVGEVLRSREVRSVIESMIALSNQNNQQPDPEEAAEPAA